MQDANRPPGWGVDRNQLPPDIMRKALPPVEAVGSSILASPEGESDNPHDEENRSQNPQQMHCETGSEKNQYK
jgi:hypothetical protein